MMRQVVTADGSRRADVAVEGERIAAIVTPEEGAHAAESAGAVVTADGLLVLPGVIDVHTHTRLATDERPDRRYAAPDTDALPAANSPRTWR